MTEVAHQILRISISILTLIVSAINQRVQEAYAALNIYTTKKL